MKLLRKLAVALAIAGVLPTAAAFAAYPDHPINIVVPFAAGGAADQTARFMAQRLSSRLGQPVVVENHSGASGITGANYVARAKPDGYTLLLVDTSFSMVPAVRNSLPYDPVKGFTHLNLVITVPGVVAVNPNVPAKTLGELLQLAREKPGGIAYGSGGVGSPLHLAAARLATMAGVQMLHVPYQGAAPAITDTLSGQVQVVIPALAAAYPFLGSGKLRPLAVTSTHRAAQLPDVPTVAEAGVPGYDAISWFGLSMPAGAPPELATRLRREIDTVLAEPETVKFFSALGAETAPPSASAPFPEWVDSELKKWRDVVRAAGITPD